MKTFRYSMSILFFSFFSIAMINAQGEVASQTFASAPAKVKLSNKKAKADRLVPDFTMGQQEATFTNFKQYINTHLSYPELAEEYAVEGTVTVLVTGSAKGKITDAKIIESLGFGCDEAVLSLLKKMPKWKPAYNYGIPVKWKQVLTFEFSLQ